MAGIASLHGWWGGLYIRCEIMFLNSALTVKLQYCTKLA